MKLLITLIFAALAVAKLNAQNSNESLSENQKANIINKTLELVKENYVFPDKFNKIETDIKRRLSKNEYSEYSDPQQFLNRLNKDLQTAGEDKHLKISFSPDLVKQIKAEKNSGVQGPASYTPELLAWIRFENYGLRTVERLEGNIGYFKFDRFTDLKLAKESTTGAMNFISSSSAIILDFRENGGGDSDASELIVNYFLPDGKKLGDVKFRKAAQSKESIVKYDPSVKKIPDNVPLYILVSNKTASAAEAVSYVLQQFKRAIIVGEQTSGKANPGELFIINDFLYMMVPTGSFNVLPTGKNWEGTGVTPDIKIDQSKALAKSMAEICTQLENRDPNEEHKQIYRWLLPEYEAQLNPEVPSIDFINKIVGNYEDDRKIIFEDRVLYYVNKSGAKKILTYINNHTFMLEGREDVRLKMPVIETPIKYFEFVWSDGPVERIKRIM